MSQEDRQQLADDFLIALNEHISNKVKDQMPSDGFDSCAGCYSYDTESKLRKALYALLEIKDGNDDNRE